MSNRSLWVSDEENDPIFPSYRNDKRLDVLKLALYDLNSAIAPRESRLMALQAALAELDHEEEQKHDEELDLHADKIIFQKLCYAVQTNRSSEEVALLCMALEMVYRASRARLALSFAEIRESLLPLAVDMLAKPPHVRRDDELEDDLSPPVQTPHASVAQSQPSSRHRLQGESDPRGGDHYQGNEEDQVRQSHLGGSQLKEFVSFSNNDHQHHQDTLSYFEPSVINERDETSVVHSSSDSAGIGNKRETMPSSRVAGSGSITSKSAGKVQQSSVNGSFFVKHGGHQPSHDTVSTSRSPSSHVENGSDFVTNDEQSEMMSTYEEQPMRGKSFVSGPALSIASTQDPSVNYKDDESQGEMHDRPSAANSRYDQREYAHSPSSFVKKGDKYENVLVGSPRLPSTFQDQVESVYDMHDQQYAYQSTDVKPTIVRSLISDSYNGKKREMTAGISTRDPSYEIDESEGDDHRSAYHSTYDEQEPSLGNDYKEYTDQTTQDPSTRYSGSLSETYTQQYDQRSAGHSYVRPKSTGKKLDSATNTTEASTYESSYDEDRSLVSELDHSAAQFTAYSNQKRMAGTETTTQRRYGQQDNVVSRAPDPTLPPATKLYNEDLLIYDQTDLDHLVDDRRALAGSSHDDDRSYFDQGSVYDEAKLTIRSSITSESMYGKKVSTSADHNSLETIGEGSRESGSRHNVESLTARSLRAQMEAAEQLRFGFLKEEFELIRVEPATHPDGVGRLLLVFRYLSRILSAMVPMAKQPGLLEALIYQLQCQSYGPQVHETELAPWRIDAIATIVNLACAEENKGAMLEEHGLLDALIRVALNDPSEEAREHAAIVLMNLAYSDENKERMVRHSGLLDTLVRLVQDDHAFTRRYATAALFTLACAMGNTECMIRYCDGEIIEVLRRVLEEDPVDEARINAAEALFNMARYNTEETAQLFGGHYLLLATMAAAVLTDGTADVRLYCARALEWLAADLHFPMECHDALLTALAHASQWTKTSCIAEALKTQALVAENRACMAQHPDLLEALGNLGLLTGLSFREVRNSALIALELISRDYAARICMVQNPVVMQALTKASFALNGEEVVDGPEYVHGILIREALKKLACTM